MAAQAIGGASGRRPIALAEPIPRPWQHCAVDEPTLRALLDDLAAGRVDADEVVRRLQRLPFADVGDALVDHHRALRQGLPEAVYGPGKTPEQCVTIVGELLDHGTGPVLLTRASEAQAKAVTAAHGPATQQGGALLYRAAGAAPRPAPSSSSPPGPPIGRSPTSASHPRRPRLRAGRGSTTSASPACTACSPTSTPSPPPTP